MKTEKAMDIDGKTYRLVTDTSITTRDRDNIVSVESIMLENEQIDTGTENVFTGGGRGIYTGGQVHRLY